ncbi:MAG: class I poly(R)-hydroxyalkanoic acid synthase [Betaproteobacteria bacterium]|nr:class I poly(R)-hydroxyalkanoic acid synthase [Betaproteobacteria bacterium]MDH3437450.1 class I poly(R)-hydroxyalkanoic acid synthase [Betaproteobacteria bacterium]
MSAHRQSQHHAYDPAELARLYADVARKSVELLGQSLDRRTTGGALGLADELGVAQAFFDTWAKLLADPFKLAEAQMRMWQDYASLMQSSWLRFIGQDTTPVAQPHKSDRRFKHEDWEQNFLYDYIKQSYLISAKHLHQAVAGVEGLDQKAAKKVDFYTRQYIDALSPSNFVLTNPEVMRETVATGGKNLVKGLSNLLDDLSRGDGEQIQVRMTDENAFKLGLNIATTPGKVIYENELMQLIQYDPATPDVYRRPLLIIPPWINKYYILDLREDNSFIKWAVDQGQSVFVMSWVNPDEQLAHKRFDDYLREGALAALDAIEKATGEREVNVIGYCLGGTLLACALAYLAAKGERRISSATFFVTMIDFAEAGELEVFIDEKQLDALEKRMKRRGYLEGAEMATTFNMLRANDLIWTFVVNNYLLGRDPFPFDLLYWNSDSTRMPATMHSFYLRNMYLRNQLTKPGGIEIDGVPIDVSRVEVPAYFIATLEDHIAPWRSTYAGARLLKGPVRFVLGGSGHIAGIVNPPAANKYCYWTNDKLIEDPEDWLSGARQHPGSWWTDWSKWIAGHGGKKVPARVPGKGKLRVIEDAPGAYVKVHVGSKQTHEAASRPADERRQREQPAGRQKR